MPIALDMIESKLLNLEFPDLTSLESYFKRMVLNAKEYNEKGSIIYEDAERLRKVLSNFMTKNNPAYKTPGFTAHPTPLPGEDGEGDNEAAEVEEESEIEVAALPRKRGRPPKNPQAHAQRKSATPALGDSQYAGVSFSALNFQQAQEKIMADLIIQRDHPE